MSELLVNTIKKADGSGALTVPAESGTVVTTASPSLGRRNLIINGAMQVAQRGTSFTNAYGYTLDRWNSQYNATSARSTVTQETSGGPAEFRSFLRVTVTTTDATVDPSDLQNIKQAIEGYNMRHTDQGTSDAKTLTCSFWVRSSVTGTYSVTLYLNSNGTVYTYPVEYTVNTANTWEYKTVTFPPQTTSATWVSSGYTNGEYAQLRFGLMIGSNYGGTADTWNASNKFGASGQTNLFATNGATWDLTGVQLEVGSVSTPYEHRSYGEELALCQRYFYRANDETEQFISNAAVWSGTVRHGGIDFPVVMRATPTFTWATGTSYYRDYTAAVATFVNGFYAAWNPSKFRGGFSYEAGTATNGHASFIKTNSSNAYLDWDAEL